MGVADVTRAELLAEVWALISPPELGDEWFTAQDMADATGEKRDTVRARLNEAVKYGKLEKCTPKLNSWAYYRKVTHD